MHSFVPVLLALLVFRILVLAQLRQQLGGVDLGGVVIADVTRGFIGDDGGPGLAILLLFAKKAFVLIVAAAAGVGAKFKGFFANLFGAKKGPPPPGSSSGGSIVT